MKKILVPCDFSKPAVNAFRFAIDLAKKSRGAIYLLNVVELPVLHDSVLMPVLNFEEQLLKELKENAEVHFQKLIRKYDTDGVKVFATVEFGAVARVITETVKKENVDLVVIGSHGATGVKEMFIGSNAEKVVRYSPVPVLVIKDRYKGPIKDIVLANNLETEDQEDFVRRVKSLQAFFKATLHIVWVNTPLNFTADFITQQKLEAFAKRCMLKDYTINIYNHTDEEKGIVEFAKSLRADLIAIGTHGRKGAAHLLNGSLAEDVANHYKGLVWTCSLMTEVVEA